MLKNTLINAIQNMMPYWSSKLLTIFNLDQFYSMGFNMIFGEFIKISFENISEDTIYIIVISLISLLFLSIGTYFANEKYKFLNNIIPKYKYLKIEGYEITSSSDYHVEYNPLMLIINNYLIKTEQVNNIKFINDSEITCVVDELNNYKLKNFNNIYIDIKRSEKDNTYKITYLVKSKTEELLNQFLDFIKPENTKMNKTLTLIGYETLISVSYPDEMKALNYILIHENKYNKIKIMDDLVDEKDKSINKKIKIYVLDNCTEYLIEDDITLSITRTRHDKNIKVKYYLTSYEHNLLDYINLCVKKYQKYVQINEEYLYKIQIEGMKHTSMIKY